MKKIIISILAVASLSMMSAQVNDFSTQGYITRGKLMFDDSNYIGCIDQLKYAQSQNLTLEQAEYVDYFIATASMKCGCVGAELLLKQFLADYPSSIKWDDVQMSLGDIEFNDRHYGAALMCYGKVEPLSLNDARNEDFRYRVAYSNMMLAEYEKAASGFNSLRLTSRYGNAAIFYEGYIAYCQGEYTKARQLLQNVDRHTAPGNKADYYLAQIYFIEKDYDNALNKARAILNRRDICDTHFVAEIYRIAGESLYNLGDEENALPHLKEYVKMTDNPLPSALYILGITEYRAGDYENAVEHLTPATAEDNVMAQSAYLFVGQCYRKLGKNSAALLAFEKSYRMDFDKDIQETAFYNYAVARMDGGRVPFGSSVAVFEDFLQRFPSSRYASEVQEYVIAGYMTDNNYESALRSIERIESPSDKILSAKQRVLYVLGTRDFAAGKTAQALSRFRMAKILASHNQDIARECDLWIGDCLYRQEKFEDASNAYVTYLNTVSSTSVNRPLAYYNLGYSRYAEKRYDDAKADFNKVIGNPGNLGKAIVADSYSRVGDCYYYESEFSQAQENYDKAYEMNPSAGDYALYQKAMMKGFDKDYKGKIRALNQVIDKYPSSGLIPSAFLEKAESYIALDDNENAVASYQKLVDKYPSTAQGRNGLLQLAITRMNMKDKIEAIAAYKSVIMQYPSSEEAKVASDDLKRIYADDGKLAEYSKFINSVPNAPQLEANEIDALTYQAAEKAYLADESTEKLESYISEFPDGAYQAQALYYLSSWAYGNGDDDKAVRYASLLVEKYPDAASIEDALAIKGEIEFKQGKGEIALKTYRELEKRASLARNLKIARLGVMRVLRDLGNHADVVATADKLIETLAAESAEMSEVRFARAYSLKELGRADDAIEQWTVLAKKTDDINGAKSAYYLALHYYDNAEMKKARKTVDALIDSNTPHQYWLARGFILLSDINRKEGNNFEADEYLKTLRDNYPGSEADIFQMIEQRLK